MTNQMITLDQSAVRTEIERQISVVGSGNYGLSYDKNLITAIESVSDSALKTELLHKFLDALTQHQNEKNLALRSEILSKIRINESIANNEISKDQARTALFNNRALILFAWCFPVAVGFAAIKYLESFVFATFIVIVLYGVLIALYFSQSTGLADTWEALTKKRRDL